MRCNKAVDECICDEYVVIGNREYNIGALLNLFEIGVKVNGVYGFGGKIFCAWCNRPIDQCICGGCVVTGSNQSSDQLVASGTWTVGGNGNGDSGGGDTPTPIPQPDNQWVPGNYLHPDECQTFFKDSLMIMPQTKTYTDCVSASITNCIMWQNNFPLEKYDSIKLAIEDNYELLYHHPLEEDGVRGFILDEFILGYSGVSVKAIPTSGFRTYINDGYPIGVVIAKNNKEKKQIYAHFISIIGYDECENLYLCYDSEEKKLIKHDLATLQATGFLYQIIK